MSVKTRKNWDRVVPHRRPSVLSWRKKKVCKTHWNIARALVNVKNIINSASIILSASLMLRSAPKVSALKRLTACLAGVWGLLGSAFPWQNRKGAGTNLLRKQASPRPPFPYIYAYRLLKNRLPGLRFSTSFAWDTAQLWYLGPGVGWTVAWDTLWKLLTLSRTICFAWLTF